MPVGPSRRAPTEASSKGAVCHDSGWSGGDFEATLREYMIGVLNSPGGLKRLRREIASMDECGAKKSAQRRLDNILAKRARKVVYLSTEELKLELTRREKK